MKTRTAANKVLKKTNREKQIAMRALHSTRTPGPSPGALGVSGAAAEAGDGFFFVRVRGNGIDEARKLEHFADVAGGIEELKAAAVGLQSAERSHQSADAGAVHLRAADGIAEDVAGRRLREPAQLRAKRVITCADGDAALQIKNGDVAGFARRNLQAHVLLLCRPRQGQVAPPGRNDSVGARQNGAL